MMPITAAAKSAYGSAVCVLLCGWRHYNVLQLHRKSMCTCMDIPGEIQLEEVVAALTVCVIVVASVIGTVVVAVVVVGAVVNITVKLLPIAVRDDVVIDLSAVVTLAFVVLVSYFLKLLSGVVVEARVFGIGLEVVLRGININVSIKVIAVLEFPIPMP